MILDTPISYDITVGAERRTPTDQDTQTIVPPVLSPVALSARAHLLIPQLTIAAQPQSVLTHFFSARVNQAAQSNAVAIMPKGLYEIEMTLATSFDYTAAPPLATLSGVEIQVQQFLPTLGSVIALLTRFPTIGSFTDFNRVRLLIAVDQVQFVLFVPASGVAQNIAAKCSLNIIRIL